MKRDSRNGMIGAALIGVGCGLTAVGIAMVLPIWTQWSLGVVQEATKKWRETVSSGVETAATFAGQVSGMAQRKFGEASKTARDRTAKAAGAVETAARRVREYTS